LAKRRQRGQFIRERDKKRAHASFKDLYKRPTREKRSDKRRERERARACPSRIDTRDQQERKEAIKGKSPKRESPKRAIEETHVCVTLPVLSFLFVSYSPSF
jgi:hypothetical protein